MPQMVTATTLCRHRISPYRGGSNVGDSSGPLFSLYSKVAEEEDNKMVERWQKDADGILIFVSCCVGIHTVFVHKP